MGDRANIVVRNSRFEDNGVWLYSHWGGSDLWRVLQTALGREQRWGDDAYLTRIIFCEMMLTEVRAGHTDAAEIVLRGETGYGIGTGPCDNGYPLLVVNTEAQTVEVCDLDKNKVGKAHKSFSFKQYLTLKADPRY